MTKRLLLPALLIALFSCKGSGEHHYKDMAKDTCDCMNLLSKDLSPEMQKVIIDSGGDQFKFDQDLMDLMIEDEETTVRDLDIFQGRGLEEMEACMANVEKKYDDVYTMLSEEQVYEKIMKELKTMKGCEISVAMIKMGKSME